MIQEVQWLTLYPPFVSPAFLFARTHFIRRTKKRSSSISEQFVPGQMMDIFQDSLDMVYINKKSSLEIMKIVRESITLGIMQRLDSEKVANLFMVEGVDIFID